MKKIIFSIAIGVVLISCSLSKPVVKSDKKNIQQTPLNSVAGKADTTKRIKPYKDVITDKSITDDGLFKIHKIDERYYFEIHDSLLNKDILIVNRISKGAAESRLQNGLIGYAGDYIGENVVKFVKGPRQKIFIKRVSYLEVADDSTENGLYRSILNSSLQPIVASFDIKTISPDSAGYVIDITEYLNGDNDMFFFGSQIKKQIGLGGLQADKSYIQRISSFPCNTEVKTIKTYTFNDQLLTYELNSSIVLLPAVPMKPRYYDERVGYFARGYLNYDSRQGVKPNYMITRWRMEPKDEDIEKYKRGELVEPRKPIVFYIDPATPKKWVPWLIQGVNSWQKAFEKAGFKNAIYALEAPKNDSAWSLEDAQHNVIVYKASYIKNASGPQVSDPRSGEILESHINWYHNVQQLLRDWYFVQAAPNDPRARKMVFDDSLMGQLIQFVCTHEVGHTLGLQHNFMASYSIPVDSLRSKNYVKLNSHTPSIMDYARFNYVAQPEDGIAVNDLIPRIGVYDDWAIEWGYKWMPDLQTKEEERSYLNKWIIASTSTNKKLLFNNVPLDLRVETEDLGDDAVKAGYYGIKNLKVVMSHLKEWTRTSNDLYTNLESMNHQVIHQFEIYLDHVVSSILGVYWLKKSVEQEGPAISFPKKDRLRSAVQFFQEELFETPKWLDNEEIFLLVGGGSVIERLQAWYIHYLLSPEIYGSLHLSESYDHLDKHYTFDEFLTDMEAGIFKELNSRANIDFYRRNLQKIYITRLINNIRLQKVGFLGKTDFTTICEDHVTSLYQKINALIPLYKDRLTKLHLQDISTRLKVALDYQKKNYPEAEIIIKSSKNPNNIFNEELKPFFNESFCYPNKNLNKNCWDTNDREHR